MFCAPTAVLIPRFPIARHLPTLLLDSLLSVMNTSPVRSLPIFFALATACTVAFAATGPADLAALRANAEKGNPVAEYLLGLVSADPNEPAHDPVEAYVWLTLSTAGGATAKQLDAVRAQLTPDQLAAAQQRVAALGGSSVSPAPAELAPSPPAVALETDRLKAALATQQMKADLREADLRTLNHQLADTTKRLDTTLASLVARDKELASLKSRTPAALGTATAPTAELDQLRRERDEAHEAATNAEAARAELHRQLQEAIAKHAALQADLVAARAEKVSLQQAAAQSATAAKERDGLAKERDTLKAQLAAGQVDQIAKIAAKDQEIVALRSAAAATAKDAAAAQASLATTITDKNSLQQQLTKLTADRAAEQKQAQATAASAKAKFDETAALAAAAAKARDAAVQERDSLAKQLATTIEGTSATAALKSQLAAKDNEIANLRAAAKENEAAHAAALSGLSVAENNRLAAQQVEIDRLRAQLAIAAAPAASHADSADAALRQQLAEATGKLDTSLRAYSLQQAELDRLQKALADLDAERAATAAKLADAGKVSDERATAGTRLQADLDAIRAAATRLTTELATTREQARLAQDAAASAAADNQYLKTRLAFADPTAAAATTSAPSRAPIVDAVPAALAPSITVASAQPPSVSTVEPRIHTVAAGDTLSGLAKKYYGSAARWTAILDANRAVLKNPNILPVGSKLKIP